MIFFLNCIAAPWYRLYTYAQERTLESLGMLKVTVVDKKDAEDCPIRNVLDRVGDKWSVLIFCVLEDGDSDLTKSSAHWEISHNAYSPALCES